MIRTEKQNNALHKYFNDIALKISMKEINQKELIDQFSDDFKIPWSEQTVSELFAESLRKVEASKGSYISTQDMKAIRTSISKRLSEITGIVDMPDNNKEIAQVMNDAGFEQIAVMSKFKSTFQMAITPSLIKQIFKSVAGLMIKKDHTSELTTKELQDVYVVFDKRISEITGVSLPFPSIEEQILKQYLT